ncbi:MAG: hypothetical protein RIT11_276 [Pseudomonadota bacterium]|jgi:maltose-binding protein MalE
MTLNLKLKKLNKFSIMKKILIILFLSAVVISCENKLSTEQSSSTTESSNSPDETSKSSSNEINQETTTNGIYSYKDNSTELQITVSGNRWMGKTVIVSGFGSEYDNQNAQYDNGIVNGNDLYESSGNIKIGYIDGNSLVATVFDRQITLRK